MHPFIRDLSFSFRLLRRNPGFTSIAVLALTLGIAGNIIVFSVLNATLLRPLPYPEPQQLTIVRWSDQPDLSIPAFFMVKNQTRSFSSLAAWYPFDAGVNISAIGSPQYVRALSVSKDFFQTLGIGPELGNVFDAADVRSEAVPTVILSYRLWTQMFARDLSTVGQKLWVNGESHRIIGVMPQGFRSYPDVEIWLPLRLAPDSMDPGSNYRVFGRLKDGISRQQVQYELDGLAREYLSIYPSFRRRGTLLPQSLQTFLVRNEREGLAILFAAVGFVFLIACTNVAVLTLVRGAASTHALAIRAALGPSRARLVLSLLTESSLLSLIGGLLGLIAAKESLPLIRMLWPANLPLIATLSIDWRVMLFTLAVGVLSPLLFGLTPALKLSNVNIAQVLAKTSRFTTSSNESVRVVRFLVFAQIAFAVMLVAGTLLMARSLLSLYSAPLGFNPVDLVVGQVSLASEGYHTTRSTEQLLDPALRQLQALPGVEAAAAMAGLPLERSLNLRFHPVDALSVPDHDDEYRPVTNDFFRTLQIPLRRGRLFTASDFSGGAPVAIVNETMARRWWPGAQPIGHYIQVDKELGPKFADVPRQVVGVVADVHEKGPDLPPPTAVYIPLSQTPDHINAFSNKTFLTSIVLRTSGDIDLSNEIRNALQRIDPALPLASSRRFSQVIDGSLASRRFIALLTGAFSIFALLLAGVGIHSVLNYQARLRGREIAIRMAVGASRGRTFRMVMEQGARLILPAVLAGLAGSFLVKILLGKLLYNAQDNSIVLILGAGVLLGLMATLISLQAAMRAASIDPTVVLRSE